jgi:hypothetical protein
VVKAEPAKTRIESIPASSQFGMLSHMMGSDSALWQNTNNASTSLQSAPDNMDMLMLCSYRMPNEKS